MTTTPFASIGIDIGKEVFHVVGFGTDGKIAFRRKIKRLALLEVFKQLPPSIVSMEACLSAHFVSRALRQFGHQPRIIPAIYVKPFVKGQKNDYNDAEAIAEAALRPNLRVVREKTQDQLDLQALHRVRSRLVSRRTATISDPCLSNRARHRSQDWGDGSAELASGDLGEPTGRDIAANARSDRGSLRRLDTSR
jgi:transposase